MPRHDQSSKTRRPAAWPWLATWALGMSALVALTAWRQVPRIEQHLLDEAKRAVLPIVSAPTTVSIDGHEATITGSAIDAPERDALLVALAGVTGVRSVVDRLVLREETVPDTDPPPVAALPVVDENGDVPPVPPPAPVDDPAPSIAGADAGPDLGSNVGSSVDSNVGTVVGAGVDVMADTVADVVTDTIVAADIDAIPLPSDGPSDGPGDVPIAEPPDAAADPSPALEPAAVPTDLPPLADEAPLPSLSLAVVDRALMLQGRIGAGQDLDELVRPALAAFDPSYLTNQIDTTAPTAVADWIEPVASLLPQLAELKDASLDIVDRQVTLAGTAPSRDSHDRLIDLALSTFTDYAVVERVDVEAEADTSTPPAPVAPLAGTVPPRALPGSPSTALPTAIREVRPKPGPLRRALEALDSERLAFESSSDVLTATSDERLDELARLLATNPTVTVEIEGHTDATGSAEFNLSLSQKRASAVKRALMERGIDAGRLIAYGYGEGVPLADNSTADGRARNRRIEFRF